MADFDEAELEYLHGQLLGRIATVGAGGRPHVTPVGFFVGPEADTIVVGGRAMASSKKYRDAQRNPEVAFVVDDLASRDPWRPRGIEIRGLAVAHEDGGKEVGERLGAGFRLSSAYLEIHPRRIRSWGIGVGAAEPQPAPQPAGSAG